jgi:hypothetical protein
MKTKLVWPLLALFFFAFCSWGADTTPMSPDKKPAVRQWTLAGSGEMATFPLGDVQGFSVLVTGYVKIKISSYNTRSFMVIKNMQNKSLAFSYQIDRQDKSIAIAVDNATAPMFSLRYPNISGQKNSETMTAGVASGAIAEICFE